LATGKPVVSRDLPAARDWSDCLTLAAAPEEFSAAVRRHLANDDEPPRRPPPRLEAETWAAKAAEFKRLALEG
jgi:hypothetical protein